MSLFREIIVDNFAGGGGASQGIYQATGRHVDIAINHDPDAIAMHEINHPETEHHSADVWDINPRQAVAGRPVALAWFSPDCKHFSKAKGGKPVNKEIRGLAWVVVRWGATVRPRVIMLENVEEFQTWGPVLKDGKPCPDRKGQTFKAFVNALKRQGYKVEWQQLRACDYGAPTIRKRLFLVARCDGQPIKWPKPTHGDPASAEVKKGKLKPWRTAAECIDWSIPCPSIFERKRPLAENTLRRIARGIQKFVIEAERPFIVTCNHSGDHFRGQGVDEPFKTILASRDAHGLVQPVLAPVIARQFGNSVGHKIDSPAGTITAGGGGKSQLVAAFLAKHYTGVTGVEVTKPAPTVTTVDHNSLVTAFMTKFRTGSTGYELDTPVHTITAGGEQKRPGTANTQALVTSHLLKLRGTCQHGQPVTEPIPTVTSGGLHIGEVRAFLLKYYGTNIGHPCDEPLQTITSKHRFGLVTIAGEDYQIVDIGMRMLEPHELFAAQGFPHEYVIDVDRNGKRISKAKQVARCGNAVPPAFSEALVRANLPELCQAAQEQAA